VNTIRGRRRRGGGLLAADEFVTAVKIADEAGGAKSGDGFGWINEVGERELVAFLIFMRPA